jgi:PAS domain S-box-containing protein
MTEHRDDEQLRALELKGLRRRVAALEGALQRAKRRGDTLREANTLLTSLLENTDDLILFCNARGEPMFFNSAYARIMQELLGFEMCPGVKPHERLEDEQARAWWEGLHRRVLGGEKFSVEYEYRMSDGQVRHFEISFNPVWVQDRVGGFSEFTREVTGRKRAEQERQELQQQLLQAQKMEALGKLAGGMAHDFNNLLAVILGNAELLAERELPAADGARIERIVKVTRRARDLTTKLLAFARREKLESQVVSLGELTQDVLEILSGSVPKNIRIHTRLAQQQTGVTVSPGQITVALLNICINACDAMPGGGKLELRSDVVDLERGDAELGREHASGRYARLQIRDTGSGIEPEQQERIFEPFYTTKTRGRGTGLGLAVSLGIVEAHEGWIALDSQPGQGTAVSVYLPQAAQQPAPGCLEQPVAAPPVVTGASILVVDDEEEFGSTVAEQLRALGYLVHVSRSGGEAVDYFRRCASEVELVLLDLMMPDLDGHATFTRLQAIDATVPVVLCSGYSQAGHATALLQAGARDYLQKPFDFSELERVIAEVLTNGGEGTAGRSTASDG